MAGLPFAMRGRWHRVVTGRMVVAALLVGVVLAVGSVPVAAVAMNLRHTWRRPPELAQYFYRNEHLVLVRRYDYVSGTIWDTFAEPRFPNQALLKEAIRSGTTITDRDPRPGFLRATLDGRFEGAVSFSAGWPVEGGCGLLLSSPPAAQLTESGLWRPIAFGRSWFIPLLPLWPGLLANTLSYAALALAAMVLVRWRRTRRRMRRGLCVACGYELGEGVGVCPECGLKAATSSRAPRVSEGA